MKEAVIEVVKRLVFAALVFVVGYHRGYQSGKANTLREIKLRYLTPGAWHTASAQEGR